MNTSSKLAITLSLGLWLIPSSNATAAAWQHGGPLLAGAALGQFNLFNKQPSSDPFNNLGGEAEQMLSNDKAKALEFVQQGRSALAQGNLAGASYFADRAKELGAQFGPNEDSPERLAADVARGAATAGGAATIEPKRLPTPPPATAMAPLNSATTANYPSTGPRYPNYRDPNPAYDNYRQPAEYQPQANNVADYPVRQAGGIVDTTSANRPAVYNPQGDNSYNRPAGLNGPSDIRFAPQPQVQPPAQQLQQQPSAVRNADYTSESNAPPRASYAAAPVTAPPLPPLPPTTQTNQPSVLANPAPLSVAPDAPLLDETVQADERLNRQIVAEVARQSRQALDMREKDPLGSVGQLKKTRAMVAESGLSAADKELVLSRVDQMIDEMDAYVAEHSAQIELDQQNRAIKDDVRRKQEYTLEVQRRLQKLVEEYNQLRNEQRFYEAEAKAKEARQLAPDEPVVVQLWEEIKFHRRVMQNELVRSEKEEGFWQSLHNAERASIGFDDNNPIVWAEKGEWDALSKRRAKYAGDGERVRHPAEIEIQRKLLTPISMKFQDAPLNEVINYMRKVSGINIVLDPRGLVEEGIGPSEMVSLDLTNEISMASALKLLLEPLNLDYVITNEVLKITSDRLQDRHQYRKVYNVADLVVPIPDFVPHDQLGIPTALARGYAMTNQNLAGGGGAFGAPTFAVNNHVSSANFATPDGMLAQNSSGFSSAPGQPGGESQADFDALIELITKTIEPDSWDEVGGPGSVAEFETNLSLVISQTQEVHEKIADLLEQLRRLQDLQVTIEVRFITLRDNFFEQIGIDFDFNIDDNIIALRQDDRGQSQTFGLGFADGVPLNQVAPPGPLVLPNGLPLPTLNGLGDIQVRQGSFNSVTPAFGGFNPASATTFGVAILSDIEAYFLVQAAQGDTRSNLTQAPKVTLFNGQAASVSDQVQQPFVISITPVVGDFAAAQAPVIAVLGEGTTLTVQAVVSPDRRFVRLTLIPFFSDIQDVQEFTFTGKKTTTAQSLSDILDGDGNSTSPSTSSATTFDEGTTIQLPTFAFTTVTTTVSVPDGGTVLLGGVKRLKEARNELGTPFLSKLPYISRLFKNVGVGRETESLMLMVTPRIIIQEEEEEKLGLALP